MLGDFKFMFVLFKVGQRLDENLSAPVIRRPVKLKCKSNFEFRK